MKCRFCNNDLVIFLDLSDIPFSISSDCTTIVNKPIIVHQCTKCGLVQKDVTNESQTEYMKNFVSHNLSDGEEQIKFIKGQAFPRSEIIINSVKDILKKDGEIIDIGTGSGSFLKSLKKFEQNFIMYGQDIQENSKSLIFDIIPQKNVFFKDISQIEKKFDVVSFIHVLSLIVDIDKFIEHIEKLTKNNGQVLLQTNDLEKNPFDLIAYDQINHFDKYSVSNILTKYFSSPTIKQDIIGELTFLTSKLDAKDEIKTDTFSKIDYSDTLNKLKTIIKYLQNIDEPIALLGTTHSSTFCGLLLDKNLFCYLDEDTNKINKIHHGKKIIHPKEMKENIKVFIPFFNKAQIENIKNRSPWINYISYFDIKN